MGHSRRLGRVCDRSAVVFRAALATHQVCPFSQATAGKIEVAVNLTTAQAFRRLVVPNIHRSRIGLWARR